jgi:hypothetical protein
LCEHKRVWISIGFYGQWNGKMNNNQNFERTGISSDILNEKAYVVLLLFDKSLTSEKSKMQVCVSFSVTEA